MESMEIDRGNTPPGGEKGEELKQIILVLIGLPGSGKSTFCEEVAKISSRPWTRVCQDAIKNGKSGTKIMCLSVAAAALEDGKSVLIDRCNIDKEQRADFLKLGSSETEKHAVVLDLPNSLCISRSVKRSGHEGKLQGSRAAQVVNHMAPKKELPKLSEGFNRIMFCYNEKDVKEAIKLYGSLRLCDSLPSGCFGQKSMDSMVQVGIRSFFKKQDTSGNAKSVPEDSGNQGAEAGSHTAGDALEKKGKCDIVDVTTSTSGSTASCSIPTLAFPSISTADFQFDLEKASDIIVEQVQEYISRIGEAKLVMVDLSHGSKILSLVKTKAAKKNIDSNKFSTFVGDITQLRSCGGLSCNVIANPTNREIKPGGGGVNAAVFKAAGFELEVATKERAEKLAAGECVIVPLPSSSPWFGAEGVTHVIHVLGPNMNPRRPDCLKDDYTKGCKILREAYSSLFEGFVSIVKSYGNEDQNGKRTAAFVPERNKKSKGSSSPLSKSGVNNQNQVDQSSTTKTWNPWAQALHKIAMSPGNHEDVVLEVSDHVVVIKDSYPKAQQHLLVIARCHGLDSLADVSGEDIPLLKEMHDVGLKWAEKLILENKSLEFRLGYHSIPSMRQLHLHVISQDFDSTHLKNKKHWLSFNTPFFLDSVNVIKQLEEDGELRLGNESFFDGVLRCHRCLSVNPNMPKLKNHVRSCKDPLTFLIQNGYLIFSEGKYR
ncbi:transcription factor bHLH140 [Salvia hispanica]|uniref:transcription factor bHLH140 n=1 Tax=Salvia hispanica TaxID=49212 RepID=UPI002009942E|nr:transcription factor bHLH140 [Salvia hispanica]